MSKNVGKIFESQWKKSVPDYVLLYKLPDPAQSFSSGNKLRFSRKPDFDYLMWDSNQRRLYALELKSVQGKSISFERTKEDRGVIHFHQIQGLNKWNRYDGITCGFIIEFRQLGTTVFLDIEQFNLILNDTQKKSFNYADLEKHGIAYTIIKQIQNRKRYQYDVDRFLKECEYECN